MSGTPAAPTLFHGCCNIAGPHMHRPATGAFKPRWYTFGPPAQPRGTVLVRDDAREWARTGLTLAEDVLRLAHEEYAQRHDQSFERVQERGGFSLLEVVALLADHVERLKAGRP